MPKTNLIMQGLQLAGLNMAWGMSLLGLLVPFEGGPIILQFVTLPFVQLTVSMLCFCVPLWSGMGLALTALFGLRLAQAGLHSRAAWLVGLIGGLPFWGLSLPGFVAAGYTLFPTLLGAPDIEGMALVKALVFSALATLMLLAGGVSVGVVALSHHALSKRRYQTSAGTG